MPISAAGSDVAPTLAAVAAALPPEGARSAWGGPAPNGVAPTLAAVAAALPPEGARSAWGGPAPNGPTRGFTLIELIVVVAIIAIASAGVSFAVRDAQATQLDREAQRLASLLESARAQSRSVGTPVRWYPTPGAFHFDGLPPNALPERWLADTTEVRGSVTLVLGPEPIIGAQEVVLGSARAPERTLRIATDGVRPFKVTAGQAP
jgi:general secretion pathway protein H